jgi:hypothetical protein
MPTVESLTVTAHLTLIHDLDRKLPSGDRRKLPDWLRAQVEVDLPALEQGDALASTTEVNRSQKSDIVSSQLERLEALVRDGYKGIGAIRSTVIGDAERAAVFASYGWTGGVLGRLSDDRVVALARIGCRNHEEVDPAFRYAPELVADLTVSLEAYDRSVPATQRAAVGSPAQLRNHKLKAATETLSQLRHWYCCASRLTSANPDLIQAGFQPRRKARSSEAVESSNKRKEERRVERERNRLQRIEDNAQRSLARLAQEAERLQQQANAARSGLSALGGGEAPRETPSNPTPASQGDVTLSS